MTGLPAELASLRALFDCFPTGVLIANDDAIYVAANAAASELLGRPREKLVGAHLADLVASGRRHEVTAQWQAFLRDGMQNGAFAVQLPDGQQRRVQFHAQANFVPGLHCSFFELEQTPSPTSAQYNGKPLVTMCAWTKQVKVGNAWLSVERYLDDHHGTVVSHGLCPSAAKRWFGA